MKFSIQSFSRFLLLRPVSLAWAVYLGLGLLPGCRCAEETAVVPLEPDASLEQAQRAAQAFSSELRSTLQGAMQQGGPVSAVEVCAVQAPAIAEKVSHTHGVRLGRVAVPGRHRNPQQEADGWQLLALQEMQAAVTAGARPEEQVFVRREGLPDGVALRMARGIPTEGLCVTCHGEVIAEPLREAIWRHYPEDGATGFAVGDLRGALWVEVPVR